MSFLNNHKLILAGAFIGALAGFVYYSFIGCNSGTCAITSQPVNSTIYGAMMGGLLFNIFKSKKSEVAMNIEQLIKENKGTIVDVRTPNEFQSGHINNSVNIPLHELSNRYDEFSKMEKPFIMVCRSGNRSGLATEMLNKKNIEAYNGGAWDAVDGILNK
ncbi:DUF6132 family protein [Salegentibacter sp. Hel_I_6]|uniref:DUF6132 family protein n=1 Tax=Salegentibacter sp. Hel_I_6 TaxID=1250278 RepID=UPI0009DD4B4F|nr:DUF6132 family protein [Salegentibacter sp. Hel_I_6]